MSLEKNREEIDRVDEEIAVLLDKRLALAKEIGKEKRASHESIYDPAREEEIISKLSGKTSFPKEGLEAIFREVFSVSRKAQQPLKVAFFGPETTFTHAAALKQFGSAAEYLAKPSIMEVFTCVEKKEVDFGVVPIENSLAGIVDHTYDMFLNSELNIVAEISLDVSQNLLSKYRLQDITKIFAQPMALAQCREWIAANLPKAEIADASSTAKSAESASLYINSAAIASELAAQKYGLGIVAKNIQDRGNNKTRFLAIGKSEPKKSAKNKTSILFATHHRAGALFDALEPLKKFKVNMTKIESRPTKLKTWEYVFFVDFEGFVDDENVKKALHEMRENTGMLKILGSYPQKAVYE
ncbi:MAG: prephenate dehydratase [archaeon]